VTEKLVIPRSLFVLNIRLILSSDRKIQFSLIFGIFFDPINNNGLDEILSFDGMRVYSDLTNILFYYLY
jgi:hypothetical protein